MTPKAAVSCEIISARVPSVAVTRAKTSLQVCMETGRQKLFVSESLDLAGIYFRGAIVPIEALFDRIGPSRSHIVVR
jgi:hypothetical protein